MTASTASSIATAYWTAQGGVVMPWDVSETGPQLCSTTK